MSTSTNALEDRILILQDQADTIAERLKRKKRKRLRIGEGGRLVASSTSTIDIGGPVAKAGFDPNEPRGKGGKWTAGGAGSEERAKGLGGWISRSKIAEALKGRDLKADAKEILASTVATIITTHNNDDQATEAVKQSILHLSAGLKISAHDAREHVSGVVNKLRSMRTRETKPVDLKKADDPIVAQLTALLKLLDSIEFDDTQGN